MKTLSKFVSKCKKNKNFLTNAILFCLLSFLIISCGNLEQRKVPDGATASKPPPVMEDSTKVDSKVSVRNPASSDEDFVKIPIFYGTDRKNTGKKDAEGFYGEERNSKNLLEVGTVEVTIPKTHEIGNLETPKWWDLNKHDPSRFILLQKLRQLPQSQFFNELSAAVQKSDKNDAFIFIHGYNNSFKDAALRTAQLTYDMGFEGVSMMYSWPSRSSVASYPADEDAVRWTIPHLKYFLKKVVGESKAKKINIVAHSMGNRALAEALDQIQNENPEIKFNQVILAAPDIDAETFKNDIAPKFVRSAKKVTLYASSKDKAIQLSKTIHKDIRLGMGGNNLSIIKDIDTIDASDLNTNDLFDHGYFVESRSAIEDIVQLLKFDATPKERNLIQTKNNSGVYWKLKK